MQIFTWRACISGLTQSALLYNYPSFTWFVVSLPTVFYLLSELFLNLSDLFTEEYISNFQALTRLTSVFTMGLCLASVLLFAEALDSALSISPSFIPIFLIFLLHIICRVLTSPPLFLSSILNLLAPPLAVCSMNGGCSSFYISIISSFFGAFGSSIIDFFMILKPLTYVLLLITVLSVYSIDKKLCSPPFIISSLSSLTILTGELFESLPLITFGNISLVFTVIWNNSRLKNNEEKCV